MDKLHKSIVAAIFKLEDHGHNEEAKELLLSYLEVRNAIDKVPKLIVTSEGSRYGKAVSLQNQGSYRNTSQDGVCLN